jgi:RimJ/RimL family protein N-acetyltransferase
MFITKGVHMNHFPIHSGGALSLGAMQREYIPLLLPGANDPEVVRGVVMTPPVTLEEEYEWYDGLARRKQTGTDVIFAILLHEFDDSGKVVGYRYIGHTGLHGIRRPDGTATSGTLIVDRTCFCKGYGKEAKMLLLNVAFIHLGLRKVNSSVKAFNGRSHGHLLACGFREVGRRRAQHWSDGRFVDEIQFDVFREDWEPLWRQYQDTKKLPMLTDTARAAVKRDSES